NGHGVERVNGTILLVTDAKAEDAGDYVCEATNPLGTATRTVHVSVDLTGSVRSSIQGDPWVNPLSRQMLFIARCDAEGQPEPEVTWYKQDDSSSNAVRFYSQKGVLVFPELEPSLDSGLYVCNASNGVEEDLTYMAVYQNTDVECGDVFDKFRASVVYRATCPVECLLTSPSPSPAPVTDASLVCSSLAADPVTGRIAWIT
ncbi:hypothetical protein EGW08_006606, partial [Elysia chlorotica]